MNHELFMGMLVIGLIAAGTGVVVILVGRFEHDDDWKDLPWRVIVPLLLAWIWLPWLVYLLTLVPWSAARCLLPPKADPIPNVTTYNPNGVPGSTTSTGPE